MLTVNYLAVRGIEHILRKIEKKLRNWKETFGLKMFA